VQHNLERIEATYKNGRMSSSMDLKCDILNFCVSSYHLCEHIKFDPALLPCTRKRVSGKARVDPLIAAAGDFANTAKHYKRTTSNTAKHYKRTTSQISELTSTPTAKIRWVDPNGGRVGAGWSTSGTRSRSLMTWTVHGVGCSGRKA